MTDPIGAINSISSVSRSNQAPPFVESLDGFLKGISKADVDSNMIMADLNKQLAQIEKGQKALSDPALYGPMGKDPSFQRLMVLRTRLQRDLVEFSRETMESKIESSINSTKINYLTLALGKVSKGINTLVQSS